MNPLDLDNLINDDKARGLFRVNRRSFTDPQVRELEQREIFDRCWLYAGHTSELKKPGDFITRKIGGRPLLIVRSADGQLRAFLNTCPHRGNLVALEKCGNARVFTCFYHAWSFDTKGSLVGLPGDESYTPAFCKSDHGLKPVPQFDDYRGMMFVCFSPETVDLKTYLGPEACKRLDYFLDFGSGEPEVSHGSHSYSVKANWKLLVENSIDGYHAMSTHQRYFRKFLPDLGVDVSKWISISKGQPAISRARSLGNGHAVIESLDRGTLLGTQAAEEMAAIRAEVVAKHGEAYAQQAVDRSRNILIFPNLVLVSMFKTVRTFYPVSPDYMEVDAWALLPSGDSPDLRQKRLDNFLSFQGPGGMATPDDVSGLENCQRGFASQQEVAWSDISRGMGTRTPISTDELQMRVFWRQWHAAIRGIRGPVDCDDYEQQAEAAEENTQ